MAITDVLKQTFNIQQRPPRKFIAIDLGTTKSIAYISGKGIIFNEASVMAYEVGTKKLVAIGDDAKKLIGKTHDKIEIFTPLKNGAITDLSVAEEFIQHICNKARVADLWKGAIVLIACPKGVTDLEKKALIDMCKNLGADFVEVEEDSLMSALGVGENIFAPKGTFILDIGGGKSSCAIISAGGIVESRSIKIAGNYIDEEIMKFVRAKHTISIGIVTSEQIKKQIGSLFKTKDSKKMVIFGRDVVTGMPKETEITDTEIRKLLVSIFASITELVTDVLEKTPSELAGDAVANGIIITGGSSQISGMKDYFADYFKIPVRVAKNSQTAVIDGCIAYEKNIRQRLIDENKKNR
ncbi:cell shape determining protein MreB [Spiroplasma syrphidicola EA-1]|uniref:Cell shape-determining protein MreB n=2 Tax=Spiroplasma TaxID=2132 RepID=R4U523_9MOLU|nr:MULTISPECIES: rod shape-determining protein [Spiroplasma]AGM25581.1 cell shape determining protein MreB [Spiroplasma chrysopicola DF-1]AGM26587.1 cell shape determining protein MreB [Spiroplasma syrphidicola EA-1]